MIDPEIVRDNYARMSDEGLLQAMQAEASGLLPEARQILQEEIQRRGLDAGSIKENKDPLRRQMAESQQFAEAAWQYALDEKYKYTSNAGIVQGLVESGMAQEKAQLLTDALGEKAKKLLAESNSDIWNGGLVCFLSIGLTLASLLMSANGGGPRMVAAGAIIYGGMRLGKGLKNKERYRKIADIIATENNLQSKGRY